MYHVPTCFYTNPIASFYVSKSIDLLIFVQNYLEYAIHLFRGTCRIDS